MSFFSFFSTFELEGRCGFYFFIFCYFLKFLMRKRGHEFYLKENFTLEKGRGVWVYLFTIFYCYLYSFVIFLTPKGGRVAWVLFFSLFDIFCIVC